jgi:hypothetical protein
MVSKRRTLKKRNYKKKSLSKRTKNPKYNKRKIQGQKRRKTRKLYKMKGCNKQNGGISATNLVSHSLLNAARFVPHTITNAYNGLVGNAAATNFLPWAGHYA